MAPGRFSLPPSLVSMAALEALGMTRLELSMSDGRGGTEARRRPGRGDAEGDAQGVTLFTGVRELLLLLLMGVADKELPGVGEGEAEAVGVDDADDDEDNPFCWPAAAAALARKLSSLFGVEGGPEKAAP